MRRISTIAVGVVLLVVVGLGVYSLRSVTLADMPLPGTDVAGDTTTLTMEFDEALNLAEGAIVKVNGVDAGKVTGIEAKNFRAVTTAKVEADAELREGATARLRYTTPLGELFVDITNPPEGAPLPRKATLGVAQTTTAPTVEDALSQASLLITGGGLAQLQTVTEELNAVLGGREEVFRRLLHRTNAFLVRANATTRDIDTALRALSSASLTLRQRERIIDRALTEIRPAAKVLRERTPDLTRLLEELRKFAETANSVAGETRADLLAMIQKVEPVLAEIAKNDGPWQASLASLENLGAQVDHAVPGDYLNVDLNLHLTGGGGDPSQQALGQAVSGVLGLLGLSPRTVAPGGTR